MTLEFYRMVLGFDISIVIKDIIDKIFLVYKILLIICIDFKLFYNYFIKFNIINKKKLIIDFIIILEVYKKQEIIKIK